MTSAGDGVAPEGKPASEAAGNDANARESSLTPTGEKAFGGELLDELLSSDDPRLQSGIDSDDSDDDIDFIRMSGLTSPDVSPEANGLDTLPDLAEEVSDPVSFYEPGVADVDAAMMPGAVSNPPEASTPDVSNLDAIVPDLMDEEPESEFCGSAPPPIPDEVAVESAAADVLGETLPEPSEMEEAAALHVPDFADDVAQLEEEPSASADDTSVSSNDSLEPPAESWDAESRIAKALEALESASSGPIESDFDPVLDPAPMSESAAGLESSALASTSAPTETEFVELANEPEPRSDTHEIEHESTEFTPEPSQSEAQEEIIDLDELDDEDDANSDLSVPTPVEPAVAEPVEETAAAVVALEPVLTEAADAVMASEADRPSPFVDESEPEDALPDAPDTTEEVVTLDESALDDNLRALGDDSEDDDAPVVESKPEEIPMAAASAVSEPFEDAYEGPATVQTHGRRSGRHHRQHESTLPRLLKAAAVLLIFGAALAYGGYEAYRWFEVQVSNPTTLYYEAENAAAMGRNLQSARLFEEFARRNPDHAFAPDALFAAGYQMQQVETEDDDLTRQYDQESLALLDEFLRRYPDHERAGRAHSLIGFVQYRMGDYRAAIDSFIDRDAILRDPAATLPMLRTLARAYAHVGEYEAAHSTYIRAANAPGNASPDEDYDELGEMYRALAQSSDSPDAHRSYQALALEHWSHAMRYPGVNPTRKNAIRLKVDLLGDLGKMEGTPLSIEVQPSDTGVVIPIVSDGPAVPTSFEATEPLPFEPIAAEPQPESAEPAGAVEIEAADPSLSASEQTNRAAEMGETSLEYHEIAPGDQLSRIALDHGISMDQLMEWNGIENPDHIEIGQRLRLSEPPAPSP